MGIPKKLTEQQIKFCQLMVANEGRKTQTECAVEAGYAEGSAQVKSSQLMNPNNYPLVAKYIGELRQENQKKYSVTFEKHITELAKIRQAALEKGAFSAAAISSSGIAEVFVAKIAPVLQTFSRFWKTACLTSNFSATASMIRSASAAP